MIKFVSMHRCSNYMIIMMFMENSPGKSPGEPMSKRPKTQLDTDVPLAHGIFRKAWEKADMSRNLPGLRQNGD